MRTKVKAKIIVIGLLAAVWAVQAELIALNVFSTEGGGDSISSLSNATTNGFTRTYTSAPADSRVINTAALASPKTIAEGESAIFSFTFDSTQIKAGNLTFRWGFDFGNTVVAFSADTGAPAYTFHNHRYDSTGGFPFTTSGTSAASFGATDPQPSSGASFQAGNSVEVITTLKRISGTNYEAIVQWGGQSYISSAVFTTDHSIDTVFIASGASSGTSNDIGDNYTISGVSVNLIPEPATIGMLGLGALIAVVIRRMHK